MTLADIKPQKLTRVDQQHLVLDDVSWDFYEHVLREREDRPIRVTFDAGSIEITSPLPKHEWVKAAIARLLELMAADLGLDILPYGSTTFRRRDKQKGLEPDACYYIANANRVEEMDEFDPRVHPAPDLAIEVDITSRSLPRLPIYAALGVPEIWRFDGERIHVLRLSNGRYETIDRSDAFPFLPMTEFTKFVLASRGKHRVSSLREFRAWVKSLPR